MAGPINERQKQGSHQANQNWFIFAHQTIPESLGTKQSPVHVLSTPCASLQVFVHFFIPASWFGSLGRTLSGSKHASQFGSLWFMAEQTFEHFASGSLSSRQLVSQNMGIPCRIVLSGIAHGSILHLATTELVEACPVTLIRFDTNRVEPKAKPEFLIKLRLFMVWI